MSDRDLLELAARAAGFNVYFDDEGQCCKHQPRDPRETWLWNPLEDDGDALRLAVNLGISVTQNHKRGDYVRAWHVDAGFDEPCGADPYVATRRAIVSAAAEIGRAMP